MSGRLVNDIDQWREQRSREGNAPWWLWPFSLLWRRQPQSEQDTVPVPVPQHPDTVPVEPWTD